MRRLMIPALIVITLAFAGCDPGAGITWVNETDKTVDVYLGEDLDDFDVRLLPRSIKEIATIKAVWEDVVVLRDEEGTLLFRQELTWDELEAQDFRFVVTPEMIAPTPTPAP